MHLGGAGQRGSTEQAARLADDGLRGPHVVRRDWPAKHGSQVCLAPGVPAPRDGARERDRPCVEQYRSRSSEKYSSETHMQQQRTVACAAGFYCSSFLVLPFFVFVGSMFFFAFDMVLCIVGHCIEHGTYIEWVARRGNAPLAVAHPRSHEILDVMRPSPRIITQGC